MVKNYLYFHDLYLINLMSGDKLNCGAQSWTKYLHEKQSLFENLLNYHDNVVLRP